MLGKVCIGMVSQKMSTTLDETVKLIEQMVHAKDTNARIEKRRDDSKVAGIGSYNSNKRPSKTSYQKTKKVEDTPTIIIMARNPFD